LWLYIYLKVATTSESNGRDLQTQGYAKRGEDHGGRFYDPSPSVGDSDKHLQLLRGKKSPDKGRVLKEVYKVLKNGILPMSEFLPDPNYPLNKTVRRRCEKAGFFSRRAGEIFQLQ